MLGESAGKVSRDRKVSGSGAVDSFDSLACAHALQMLADKAAEHASPAGELALESEIVSAALDLMSGASAWLDLHRALFDKFAGDALLCVAAEGSPIVLGVFVSTLRKAALELIQVRALARLRGSSVRRNRSAGGQ